MPKPLTVALCAGEASGDKLGAALVEQLSTRLPQGRFYAIGGAELAASGAAVIENYQPLAVMGYWDALRGLPEIVRLQRRFLRYAEQSPPDIFIGIDAPDFNLRLAHRLRQRGSLCIQYVAPSVWMWRRERLAAIAESVDAVLCLLPFEKAVYTATDSRAYYVGHPAARRVLPVRAEARRRLGYGESETVIALLPGSRRSELARHLPLLREAVAQLACDERRRFVAALASSEAEAQLRAALPQVHCAELDTVLAAADIALVKSGTVALEVAFAGVPMLVFYRTSPLAAFLARRREFYLPYFSLPNILSRRFIVAELLQEEATAAQLVGESERLLADPQHRDRQKRQFAVLREMLADADVTPAAAVADEFAARWIDN